MLISKVWPPSHARSPLHDVCDRRCTRLTGQQTKHAHPSMPPDDGSTVATCVWFTRQCQWGSHDYKMLRREYHLHQRWCKEAIRIWVLLMSHHQPSALLRRAAQVHPESSAQDLGLSVEKRQDSSISLASSSPSTVMLYNPRGQSRVSRWAAFLTGIARPLGPSSSAQLVGDLSDPW